MKRCEMELKQNYNIEYHYASVARTVGIIMLFGIILTTLASNLC